MDDISKCYIKILPCSTGALKLYIFYSNGQRKMIKLKYSSYKVAVNRDEYSWDQIKVKKKNRDAQFYRDKAERKRIKIAQQKCGTKEGYSIYLKTKHWRDFRKSALEYYKGKCASCGTTSDLRVHHLHYNSLFNEKFEDVKILCKCCHNEEHGFYGEGDLDREFAALVKSF